MRTGAAAHAGGNDPQFYSTVLFFAPGTELLSPAGFLGIFASVIFFIIRIAADILMQEIFLEVLI